MHYLLLLLVLAQTTTPPPNEAPIPRALRLAREHARGGEPDKAFAQLTAALDNGFANADLLLADNELLAIRTDARWTEVIARARRAQWPCRNTPEYRQFDFWLGEWDVQNPAGQKIGRSSIQLVTGECIILENYETPVGYSGKSISAWHSGEKRWEQYYVDTAGGARFWTGNLAEGKMVMTTEFEQRGTKVLNRMTYAKEGEGKVRQTIDTSLDGGKTWAPGFNGLYVRRQ
jgi:hypothetical protein